MKMLNVLLIASIVAMIACGKDKNEPSKKSNRDIMSSHSWRITAFTVNPPMNKNGVLVSDFLAIQQVCSQDDLFIFPTDSTYTELAGATKCNPTDPDTLHTSPCILSKDEKQVTIEDYPNPLLIKSIDDKKMIWEGNFSKNAIDYTVTYTYESK